MKNQRLILRLDDAADRMDIEKWLRMEKLLDHYDIKPLVGVIPDCRDPLMNKYEKDPMFWDKVHAWISKDWIIAMHGFQHIYDSKSGGINPINLESEFAGHTLEEQKEKLRKAYKFFESHSIDPKVFFAPSHTFDRLTLDALKTETNIRIISDTVSWDSYSRYGLKFIPVQSGRVRKLPFRTITFCYHPNTMSESEYNKLESFLQNNSHLFVRATDVLDNRNFNVLDLISQKCYLLFHNIRRLEKKLF